MQTKTRKLRTAVIITIVMFAGYMHVTSAQGKGNHGGNGPQNNRRNPHEIQQKVDELAGKFVQFGGVGLVIGVIDGNKQYLYEYGVTAKASGQKPTPDTLFEIGSITKTFTAAVLADEVRKGHVAYNDPLQKFVPSGINVPSLDGRKISLLDLATHTSGLPRKLNNATYPTPPQAMFNFIDHYTLTEKPGTHYLYSNLAFGLLAVSLAREASAQNWMALVRGEINQPLGLVDTLVDPSPQQIARRAQGYNAMGGPAPYEMSGFPAMNGAGALYSTGNEMMKFLNYNLGLAHSSIDPLLDDLQKSWRPVNNKPGKFVGLAWQISEGPPRLIWKNGSTAGFKSFIGFCREKQAGVFVLSNTLAIAPDPMGNELLRFLVGAGADLGDGDDDNGHGN